MPPSFLILRTESQLRVKAGYEVVGQIAASKPPTPSLHFSMADKALNRILQVMKELGLTPVHRVGVVRSTTPESLELEAFLARP